MFDSESVMVLKVIFKNLRIFAKNISQNNIWLIFNLKDLL